MKKDNPKFSILVANFNNGKFFEDCYNSIIKQTYQNWECVIVDDASTDDSVSIIRSKIENDSRFVIYQNESNKGCGFTKNRCAALAKGDIAGFLDPDDTIDSEALAVMVQTHLLDKNIALVTSKYYFTDDNLNVLHPCNHASAISEHESLLIRRGAATHFASFKMDLYNKTSGIDAGKKRAIDQDLYYKLEEVGKHCFMDKFLYYYRGHSNSISLNKNAFKAEWWHLNAIKEAFLRRKKNKLKVKNIELSVLRSLFFSYYRRRFVHSKHNLFVKNYFLLRSIYYYPYPFSQKG